MEDNDGCTSLHWVVEHGYKEAILLLLVWCLCDSVLRQEIPFSIAFLASFFAMFELSLRVYCFI